MKIASDRFELKIIIYTPEKKHTFQADSYKSEMHAFLFEDQFFLLK